MTTALNDISDLSRILQENPEWREHFRALLLTQEILDLPAAVAALTAELRAFIAEQREINARADARMDALTAELRELAAELRGFIAEQREINARADARMDALTAELREFIAEQRQWNEEQRQWNEEQRQWNEEQKKTNAAILARLDRVEADIKEMKDDISQLKGRHAEWDTHRNIHNLLQERHPELRRVVILKSDHIQFAPELNNSIDDAEDTGIITLDERKALRAVDLVVQAVRRGTQETIYFAVEVSRTVDDYDVERAANRAEILGRVIKGQGLGAVIGGSVLPLAADLAEDLSVSVITSSRLNA